MKQSWMKSLRNMPSEKLLEGQNKIEYTMDDRIFWKILKSLDEV